MKDNTIYLRHIIDSIAKIKRYLNGISFAEFEKDEMRVSAVIREMEIIGEAAHNVEIDFQSAHPEIEWRKMTDMRNFLIHQYFGVSEKIVWDTYQNDLNHLEEKIGLILEK